MYCTKCGRLVPEDADRCPVCGWDLSYESGAIRHNPPGRKSSGGRRPRWGTALLLVAFLLLCAEAVFLIGIRPYEIRAREGVTPSAEQVPAGAGVVELIPVPGAEEAESMTEEPILPETEPTATPTVTYVPDGASSEAVSRAEALPVEEIAAGSREEEETRQAEEVPEEEFTEEVYEETENPQEDAEDSGSREAPDLSGSDLSGMSAADLRLARNEIYARHGLIFKSEDLQAYFSGQSWYSGTVSDVNEISLSEEEAAYIQRIVEYEEAMGYNQ